MNSHSLAKLLLEMPNIPIATFANNHIFLSETLGIEFKPFIIGSYAGDHIVIGNCWRQDIDKKKPNIYSK